MIPVGDDCALAALELAESLRDAGIGVVVDRPQRGLGKSLKYADRLGLRTALLLGEDEMAAGTVAVRDLRNGSQETISRDRVAARLGE